MLFGRAILHQLSYIVHRESQTRRVVIIINKSQSAIRSETEIKKEKKKWILTEERDVRGGMADKLDKRFSERSPELGVWREDVCHRVNWE